MAGIMNGPLVAVVGETGSGKSALALELAHQFDGELICADSRTVYKGMDIATAKPTAAERAAVPHHGLDLMEPDEPFTAADFKTYAVTAIEAAGNRGKLPILVGGSGLYVDAVLYDFSFRAPADPKTRAALAGLSVDELQRKLAEQGIPLPANARNPRHLIRALETGGERPAASSLREHTLVLGLAPDRDRLRSRLERRVDDMVVNGLIDEVRRLSERYGWDLPAMQAPGYRAFRQYLEGTVSLDEAKALFVKNDMDLAKRQRTWFRRNNSIQWLPTGEELGKSVELITTLLNT